MAETWGEHSHSGTSSSTSPTGSAESSCSSFRLDQDEQYLLHHYMTNLTARHMAPVLESSMFPILNPAITRNAAIHPYVQQAVLCYSALHLASITRGSSTQQSPYLVAALRHKAAALAHFRPILASGVTPLNCEAAFTASAVLVACAFALPVADPFDSTGSDRIELLSQVIGLFRGCLALFRLNWNGPHPLEQFRSPQVRQSIASSYTSEISWPDAERSLERVLEVINDQDQSNPPAQKRKESLLKAATSLHKVIRRVAASESDYSVVCMWLGKVDSDYADLLQNKDPLALVLMAHWSASRNHYSEDVWWTRGWPQSALQSIVKALEGQHMDLLQWCISEVGINQPGY
ncbi:hypothetical protein HJFPF1_01747 [Paramyrothecium foliicola]|nr:hypothetical protein HJFPF1_01747 [Paramyrothecium foliicola]